MTVFNSYVVVDRLGLH